MTPARDPKQEGEAEPKQPKKAIQQSNPGEHSTRPFQKSNPGEPSKRAIQESNLGAFQKAFQKLPEAFERFQKPQGASRASKSLQKLPDASINLPEASESLPEAPGSLRKEVFRKLPARRIPVGCYQVGF